MSQAHAKRCSMVTPDRGRLADKVILVVGGTSGIGLSAALAFQREGAAVAVTGRNKSKLQAAREALGPDVLVVESDAQESVAAQQVVDEVTGTHGRLDALYHVAGGSGRSLGDGPLHEISDEGWNATIRLNLSSVFFSNRAALNHFIRQGGGGCILNMASVLGFSPSTRFFATHAYSAAKAAIIGMTKSAAAYYAPSNIRINGIAPGLVETPMAERAAADERILQFAHSKQPLDGGRIGIPSDYDGAAVFLLSDEAKFMTGQTVIVDGGWSCSEGQYG